MFTRATRIGMVAAIFGLFCNARLDAQEETVPPRLTALSSSDAAMVSAGSAEIKNMGHQRFAAGFDGEEILEFTVAAGQHLMAYSPSGRVTLLVIGPARVACAMPDGRITWTLLEGMLAAYSTTPQHDQVFSVSARTAADAAPLAEATVGAGWTVWKREGAGVVVGFLAGDEAPPLSVRAQPNASLRPGEWREFRADGSAPAAPAMAAGDLFGLVNTLAVSSAIFNRQGIEDRLIDGLVSWEQYGSARQVKRFIELPELYEVETRQTTVAVATPVSGGEQAGAAIQTPGVPGANEVPTLSPAAISVGGVTAISNNSRAADQLTRTGSRGLGFNGLRQLAIPGRAAGQRTIGPAGVAARPEGNR